jgi:hypothetical protein
MKKLIAIDLVVRTVVEVEDDWKENHLRLQNAVNSLESYIVSNHKGMVVKENWIEAAKVREIKPT